jgi:hypothetical protein
VLSPNIDFGNRSIIVAETNISRLISSCRLNDIAGFDTEQEMKVIRKSSLQTLNIKQLI